MNNLMIIILLIFSFLSVGCAKKDKQLSEQAVTVKILAEKDINPNKYNHAAPLSLFIFQLKTLENFQKQDDDFFFFSEVHGDTTFSQDVIVMKELSIKPGESREVNFPRQPDESAFGIIAAYRNIDEAEWKRDITFPKVEFQPWYKKFLSVPERKLFIHIKKLSIEAKVME
ncbi:type VI secretion system lipoprotein TssJ [Pantoea sp.]|uniref:type VI secretion system lipoprotein TssJ n=1 Tax=Pantoea sp. TaxID=69393 RepID=UPI0028A013F1|nr:type VI secretion system lipoprotein TssJ [Pantoea sp.]